MDIIQFIAQFFYRIRYWLLWGWIYCHSTGGVLHPVPAVQLYCKQ